MNMVRKEERKNGYGKKGKKEIGIRERQWKRSVEHRVKIVCREVLFNYHIEPVSQV